MPPPLSSYENASPQLGTSPGQQAPIDLAGMSIEQRHGTYRHWFSRKTQLLKNVKRPAQCKEFPAFTKEISAAYLRHTTFSIKLWVNYDAAAKNFYFEEPGNGSSRFETCGQVVLSPDEERDLCAVVSGTVEFSRVRFEVGTPFRTWCAVDLCCMSGSTQDVDLDVTIAFKDLTEGEHPLLMEYVRRVCDYVVRHFPQHGANGLRLQDLVDIAAVFKGRLAEDLEDEGGEVEDMDWRVDSGEGEEGSRGRGRESDRGRGEGSNRGRREKSESGRREESDHGRDEQLRLLDHLYAELGGMESTDPGDS